MDTYTESGCNAKAQARMQAPVKQTKFKQTAPPKEINSYYTCLSKELKQPIYNTKVNNTRSSYSLLVNFG